MNYIFGVFNIVQINVILSKECKANKKRITEASALSFQQVLQSREFGKECIVASSNFLTRKPNQKPHWQKGLL